MFQVNPKLTHYVSDEKCNNVLYLQLAKACMGACSQLYVVV